MTPQIQSLLPQAVQYFDQGNLDAAEQLLNKVLQMHAKNFDALLILGVIKGIKGEQQEAIRLFRKAVVAEPDNNWAQFNLAKALSETGKDEEAIPHHKKAVQLAPQHADAWLNYGVSLSALDRPADAAACYERLIGFHPEYFQAWSNLGLVLHKLERYEEALQALDKALSLNPQLIEAWVNKGAVLRKQAPPGSAASLQPGLRNRSVACRRLAADLPHLPRIALERAGARCHPARDRPAPRRCASVEHQGRDPGGPAASCGSAGGI
ncbi:tetratricopeptide repeat protein [Herbaspirillum robiniae]|uniref:tetratricopeptide repeat protein n=1 Tax=Herbaspirillum robiniae TaxID=2014887 RepID=UPI003D774B6A